MGASWTVLANAGDDVPVSFGFHPYIGLPGVPRDRWRLVLPWPKQESKLDIIELKR